MEFRLVDCKLISMQEANRLLKLMPTITLKFKKEQAKRFYDQSAICSASLREKCLEVEEGKFFLEEVNWEKPSFQIHLN